MKRLIRKVNVMINYYRPCVGIVVQAITPKKDVYPQSSKKIHAQTH